ncbi:hypothetical protein RFI_17432 [Reticulomyxa filosa]|uniref:Uncharacterized protein n=1 Tax=Reticulomyxa filosa TaxID=46433 RepID=X6N1L6_RETFI|nr:hypothetical protein RFI_17432 [Reticulomyxa filosa]|eukprot:ETO19798.1 hypothetical protein RFI_17432 [Reticulomyxa filosa]
MCICVYVHIIFFFAIFCKKKKLVENSVTFTHQAVMESKVYQIFEEVQVCLFIICLCGDCIVDKEERGGGGRKKKTVIETNIQRSDFNWTQARQSRMFLTSLQSGLRDIESGLFDIFELFWILPDGGLLSTSYNDDMLNDNLTTSYTSAQANFNGSYDPRCRSFFVSAMNYTFSGVVDQNVQLLNHTYITVHTAECERAAHIFQHLFFNFSSNSTSTHFSAAVPNVAWTKLILQGDNALTLSASKAVTSKNGEWLGAVAVFFYAQQLTEYLEMHSLGPLLNENRVNSTSWIFENDESHYMVASSDQVVFNPQKEQGIGNSLGLEEFTTFSNLYWSTNHPNSYIAIASQEIVQVQGIDSLSVNSSAPLKEIPLPVGKKI